jgi:hypothetical protein
MDKAYELAHNMDLQLVDTIPMKGRRQWLLKYGVTLFVPFVILENEK